MSKTPWAKAKRVLRKYGCQNATELMAQRIGKYDWIAALSSIQVLACKVEHAFYIDMDHPDIAPYRKLFSVPLFLADGFSALHKNSMQYFAKHGWDPVNPVCLAYNNLATKVASVDLRVIVLHRANMYNLSLSRISSDLRFLLNNFTETEHDCAVCMEKVSYLSTDLYDCVHGFCTNCVKSLLEHTQLVCPICRAEKRDTSHLVIGDIGPEIYALVSALDPHPSPCTPLPVQ